MSQLYAKMRPIEGYIEMTNQGLSNIALLNGDYTGHSFTGCAGPLYFAHHMDDTFDPNTWDPISNMPLPNCSALWDRSTTKTITMNFE